MAKAYKCDICESFMAEVIGDVKAGKKRLFMYITNGNSPFSMSSCGFRHTTIPEGLEICRKCLKDILKQAINNL